MSEAENGSRSPRTTERSEGVSKQRRRRETQYPCHLVVRLDLETMTMLEQDAKENDRTTAGTVRRALRLYLFDDRPKHQLTRTPFEDSP